MSIDYVIALDIATGVGLGQGEVTVKPTQALQASVIASKPMKSWDRTTCDSTVETSWFTSSGRAHTWLTNETENSSVYTWEARKQAKEVWPTLLLITDVSEPTQSRDFTKLNEPVSCLCSLWKVGS